MNKNTLIVLSIMAFFIAYGDGLEISTLCHFDACPCEHDILLRGTPHKANATTIVELFKRRNLRIPKHFAAQAAADPRVLPDKDIMGSDHT
jgi:hypothetical protein